MLKTSRKSARIYLSLAFVLMSAASACLGAPSAIPASLPSPLSRPTNVVTVSASQVPELAQWLSYQNEAFGFTFLYPPESLVSESFDKRTATITLPMQANTNVIERYMTVSVLESQSQCVSPLAEGWEAAELESQEITFNRTTFLKQSHAGVAAGTSRVWVAYSTQQAQQCISLGFVLSTYDPNYLDPTAFPNPPSQVDVKEELALFAAIAATFTWLK